MEYNAFSQFIVRSPFLPYNKLECILSDKNRLLKQWSDEEILDAIFIASPVLFNELNKSLVMKSDNLENVDRLLFSFARYITRMATRCTPFGLFAGCAVGNVGVNSKIELENSINRTTRLDMFFLCTLYDDLLKIPEIKNRIKYYPNTSLYLIGKKYRYVECLSLKLRRKYQITEVARSVYLDAILNIAISGNTRGELIHFLVDKGVGTSDASIFVDELIDSQILVGELYQSVTGEDFFSKLIELLKSIEFKSPLLTSLIDIQSLLKKLDFQNGNKQLYAAIISKVDALNVKYEKNFLLQVDLAKKISNASLSYEIIDELKSVMLFLNKITPMKDNDPLNQFQYEFYKRYEEREIPLLEALDPELGIGYPVNRKYENLSPLIENFNLPMQDERRLTNLDLFHQRLLKKTIECISTNSKELILNDEDVKDFTYRWDDLPPTIYTMLEVIRSNPNDILLKLNFFGGNCGANLLTRFAHTDDGIMDLVNNIIRKEEELVGNDILCEIVHLPESRVGNILFRPHIRKNELLLLTDSDLPKSDVVNVSDLMISVRKGKLVIRSKKLNKYIIPRLTSAHNYQRNPLPAYHFLCDMQHLGRNMIFFNWGTTLESMFPYRPRVKYKNTILSAAMWSIKNNEIKFLFTLEEGLLLDAVVKWRLERSIPRYVYLVDNDNKLFVDWDNIISIFSLFAIIKNLPIVVFSEFLFEQENALVKERSDVYLNECIVAFYKNKNK